MPVQLRRRRRPDRASTAPCSGVLKRVVERLPSSSIQPEAIISSRGQVALQRRHDAARVGGERAHARVAAERVELHGEQAVGGLGLPVGLPLVVAASRTAGRRSGSRRACARSRRARRRARRRRAASAGQSRFASAKWPRWLVANCASQPGPTRVSGQAMIAALLMRMSIGARRCPGSARGERRGRCRGRRGRARRPRTRGTPGEHLLGVLRGAGPARRRSRPRRPAPASSPARGRSSRR